MDLLCYLYFLFVMLLRLVVKCLERADLLALVCDVYFVFVPFPCGILGQVWYLMVSIPDLCRLSYFDIFLKSMILDPFPTLKSDHGVQWNMFTYIN